MKRRSARPFTVEIKHTRSANTAPRDLFGRPGNRPQRSPALSGPDRTGVTPREPRASADVAAAARPAAPPARRVLPALTPIYALSEPESPKQPSQPRVEPRKATGRARVRRQTSVTTACAEQAPAVGPRVVERVQSAPPAHVEPPTGPPPHPARRATSGSGWRNRQDRAQFRPGERWKSRLPRICR